MESSNQIKITSYWCLWLLWCGII